MIRSASALRIPNAARKRVLALLSAALVLGNTPAAVAAPSPNCSAASIYSSLSELIASGDLPALLAAARKAKVRGVEAELLNGLVAGLHLRDEEAVRLLRRSVARGATPATFYAATALSAAHMRLGQYGNAASALEIALRPEAEKGIAERDLISTRRFRPLVEGLRNAPPQRGPSQIAGNTAVARDKAGLPTAILAIEGQSQSAILDTGANLSVVVQSRADALGLQLLPARVTVASPVAEETPARLGIARRLTVAGAEFRNVVFLVLPDQALTFASGAYKIEAILGFPVLRELGRLSFVSKAGAEEMSFRRAAGRAAALAPDANLFVEGFTPKVIGCLRPEDRLVQFALDSGAQGTSLRPRFGSVFPARLAAAAQAKDDIGGVGGVITRQVRVIGELPLEFGTSGPIVLRDIRLSAEETLNQPGDHGRLGQDVLRARGGYVLDFQRMRFDLGVGQPGLKP